MIENMFNEENLKTNEENLKTNEENLKVIELVKRI